MTIIAFICPSRHRIYCCCVNTDALAEVAAPVSPPRETAAERELLIRMIGFGAIAAELRPELRRADAFLQASGRAA